MSEMSEGVGSSGVFGSVTAAVRRLTPEFLALALLNVVFIVALAWLFSRQNDARERVLTPLLTACSHSIPIEVLQYLAPLGAPSP
jgi:glycopeptide antibiotics resistance protein